MLKLLVKTDIIIILYWLATAQIVKLFKCTHVQYLGVNGYKDCVKTCNYNGES